MPGRAGSRMNMSVPETWEEESAICIDDLGLIWHRDFAVGADRLNELAIDNNGGARMEFPADDVDERRTAKCNAVRLHSR